MGRHGVRCATAGMQTASKANSAETGLCETSNLGKRIIICFPGESWEPTAVLMLAKSGCEFLARVQPVTPAAERASIALASGCGVMSRE